MLLYQRVHTGYVHGTWKTSKFSRCPTSLQLPSSCRMTLTNTLTSRAKHSSRTRDSTLLERQPRIHRRHRPHLFGMQRNCSFLQAVEPSIVHGVPCRIPRTANWDDPPLDSRSSLKHSFETLWNHQPLGGFLKWRYSQIIQDHVNFRK